MGRNGAGNSTTLKSIMGLMDRREGRVRFMDEDITPDAPNQIARKGLGFVQRDYLSD